MSLYKQAEMALESCQCKKCHGLGTISDAEPGDIYCNTFTCHSCDGSGVDRFLGLKALQEVINETPNT